MTPERQAAIDLVEEAVGALLKIVCAENDEVTPSVLTAWSVVASRTLYPAAGGVPESIVGVYSQDTLPEWQQAGLLLAGSDLVRDYMVRGSGRE